MWSVILCQDKLSPKLFNDPMRKIIVLKKVNFLPNFSFIKMVIEFLNFAFDFINFSYCLLFECFSFWFFHELNDFLWWNVSIIDQKWIFHGILIYKVNNFDPFNIVLFVNEKVQLLPLLRHNIELSSFKDELAQSLQYPNMKWNFIAYCCSLTFVYLQ